MAVISQEITDTYAIYNGDCIEVMPKLRAESIHLSIYSPPFCGLYNYSSSPRDLSNCRSYEEFFEHYEFVVKEIFRLTHPGRLTGVHCMDVPDKDGILIDFPGDIIRLHARLGFRYVGRYHVWKEPLSVRMRTMANGLKHQLVVEDSAKCSLASADYLLMFRKKGENLMPITHEHGFTEYAGSREVPADLLSYREWQGHQTGNKFSQWIWRQYASAFWDDIRIDRVLPYKESREPDDEKHIHPLQLDVIERCIDLWSNPGENVLTPFMGVGSEVYSAVKKLRRGVGIELKTSYYKQAVKNLVQAREEQYPLLSGALNQRGYSGPRASEKGWIET